MYVASCPALVRGDATIRLLRPMISSHKRMDHKESEEQINLSHEQYSSIVNQNQNRHFSGETERAKKQQILQYTYPCTLSVS